MAWPADLYAETGSANQVSLQDLTSFLAPTRYFGTSPTNGPYNARWDLVPGAGSFADYINLQDLTSLITVIPDMFGVRAFNGPACIP
jgi:hypothetical protein